MTLFIYFKFIILFSGIKPSPLSSNPKIVWPEDNNFAFTIFDDTDHSTVENTKPIYDFLNSIGIKTTKSVWTTNHKDRDHRTGCSLQDKEYRIFIQELAEKGFEISLHLNAGLTSTRDETIKGLKFFREVVGYYPKSLANHDKNLEGIYWGEARFTGLNKFFTVL
ncbi:hypothetical protein [Dethiosulfatarculus sandiegensis]|uniref:NodB homology domain-containing protein n=1 Tax=Dethiosulfatarculus sandiegensis TaxID=1429043 RepID=A0A0D2G9Q8_9BACT|nr:hypothetical protein [Dethiosulfatarculus sandiegensis]KIX11587.1 hypothetical protein X474_24860 [Dethiosulfatarculus sandiegensis]